MEIQTNHSITNLKILNFALVRTLNTDDYFSVNLALGKKLHFEGDVY